MTDVQHLPEQQRFVIHYEGDEAVLAYRLFTNGNAAAIDFTSTYVPPAYRGKGLAEKLVRAGLKWAKAQGYELHASCWYVEKFIR
jgi:predicted GNAT family acetyltransferase